MSVFQSTMASAARTSIWYYQLRRGATWAKDLRVSQRLPDTAAAMKGQPHRCYSTNNNDADTILYEDIQSLIKKGEGYCLIDVREPGELTQGTIPTSRNIPLSQFQSAWSLSPEEFKQTVGFDKPTDDSKVILYCQAGIRSKSALDFLREIGYKNVLNYAGSWKDYAQRSKQ